MTVLLCVGLNDIIPLYLACYKSDANTVQLLLDHGVQANVPDMVSDISCIHVKLFNTTEINKALWS